MLTFRAAIQPATVDVENRTVEVVWTTGARVLRGFFDRYWEELSLDPEHVRLDRLNNGAPLLDSHQMWELRNVIGVVEAGTAKLEGKRGVARVRFSKREDVEPVWRDVQDGIIQNISVGYRVYKYEKIEDGEDKIPVYRAVDWEPIELSAVPAGADDGAGFRSDKQPVAKHQCDFVFGSSEERTMKRQNTQTGADAIRETPADNVPADDAQETPAPETQAEEAKVRAAREEGVRIERQRVDGIRAAVRAARLGDEFADRLIKDGTALDKARALILDELAKRDAATETSGHVRVESGEDEREKRLRGAEQWMIRKAGLEPLFQRAAEQDIVKRAGVNLSVVDPGEFRGMSLLDMARDSLERAGVRTRGLSKMELVGKAFTHRSNITQSTSDFAVLLENVMHKTLLASYAVQDLTWRRIAARSTVTDFRVHNRYRMGMFGKLDKVSENGEFKNKAILDAEKATIQASTVGNIINVSRQMIVNDDLSAFTRLLTMLGRAAALSVEIDVYAEILLNSGLGRTQSDGQPLFHSNRSNVGTGSVLSVEGLDADRVLMAKQKDPWGNEFIDLRPAVLLVPIELEGTARVINDAQYDPDTPSKLQKPNMVRGLFRDIVASPRLSVVSQKRRYLLADPNIAPVWEVAFLEGQETPVLESQDGWRIDGTEMKVRFDYGVATVDYRGAVTNAGEAQQGG